jgi:hypothetical protein
MSLEGFFGESVDLMVLLFLLVASGTPLIRKEKQILDHRLLFLERNGSHAGGFHLHRCCCVCFCQEAVS